MATQSDRDPVRRTVGSFADDAAIRSQFDFVVHS
jgi:hypothetical protein